MEKLSRFVLSPGLVRYLKQSLRLAIWLFFAALGGLGLAFAAFTWGVLPNLDRWRPDLEHYLSQSIGHEVSIGKLSGRWEGIAPSLSLQNFTLSNPRKGSALTLQGVSIEPSWTSLLVWAPRFRHIVIDAPQMELVRGKDGVLYFNGFDISSGPSDSRFRNWVLQQDSIEVHGASLRWRDDWLGLPALGIDHGDLALTDSLFGHHLHVEGRPGQGLGQSVVFDARWRGDDVGQLATWSGKVGVKLQGARVGVWSRYLEQFGFLRSGQGSGEVQAQFDRGELTALTADVQVKEAGFRPTGARDIHLPEFSGKLDIQRGSDAVYRIHASDLTVATDAGTAFDHASIEGQFRRGDNGFGELSLNNVDLAPLAPIIHALAVDRNPLFGRFAPIGKLSNLSANWKGPFAAPHSYRLSTHFERLGWNENGPVPGLSGASGDIHFDEKGGGLNLASVYTKVSMGHVFAKPLNFDKLQADLVWTRDAKGVHALIKKAEFANADLSGRLAGEYFYTGHGAGRADLTGIIDAVGATRVVDYLPYVTGRDTIQWLTTSLKGGSAQNVRFVLKGDLDQFPFKGGKGGQFSVRGDVVQGKLRFDPAWPELDKIKATLAFENEKMTITGDYVESLGVPLKNVVVSIPDLVSNGSGHLLINGQVEAPLAKMLAYTVKSPIDHWLGGFTGQIAAAGESKLDLHIDIPLSGSNGEKVLGNLDFAGNSLKFTQLPIPAADNAHGRLTFTEHGIDMKAVQLSTLGGNFTLRADTNTAGKMRFSMDGEADSHQVFARYVPELAPFVDGRSRYEVKFQVGKGLEVLTASSPLVGTRLSAPDPADKPANVMLPLMVTLRPDEQTQGMQIDYSLEPRARGAIKTSPSGDLLAGTVLVGRNDHAMPARGIAVRVRSASVNLDAWRGALDKVPDSGGGSMPLLIDLNTDALQVAGYRLTKANMVAEYNQVHGMWRVDLTSQEGAGIGEFRDRLKIPLRVHFTRLALPLAAAQAETDNHKAASSWSERYPAMDFLADSLIWRGRELGRMEFLARREPNIWAINRLRLTNNDGVVEANLVATEDSEGHQQRVDSNFTVNATDWGSMLARIGEANQVINGKGTLRGHLNWNGGLSDINTGKLNGTVALDVQNGRFAKLEPGAAKLLGVLSLQSLGRRLRLDFSDVFQRGFSFDKLAGEARVQDGVFHTDKISLQGPSANITLKGEVDLAHDRQRLEVRVLPYLSESAALGAALVNPVAGVAALVGQKVLQDPLNKLFAVDYLITGPLSDPEVQELNGRQTLVPLKKP